MENIISLKDILTRVDIVFGEAKRKVEREVENLFKEALSSQQALAELQKKHSVDTTEGVEE